MARPVVSAEWASGAGRRLEPTAGERADGWLEGTRSPARKANWGLGTVADWVLYFEEIIDAAHEHIYPTPKARQVILPLASALQVTGVWSVTSSAWLSPSPPNGELLYFPVAIPSGCVITGVDVMLKPGLGRVTGLMTMGLIKWTHDFATPAAGAPSTVATPQVDDGTTNLQVVSLSGLNETVDRDVDEYIVSVACGVTGPTDLVYAPRLSFTDPGPRNF